MDEIFPWGFTPHRVLIVLSTQGARRKKSEAKVYFICRAIKQNFAKQFRLLWWKLLALRQFQPQTKIVDLINFKFGGLKGVFRWVFREPPQLQPLDSPYIKQIFHHFPFPPPHWQHLAFRILFFCAFTKGKTHCEEFFLIKRTHFFFGPAEILALSKKICHKISREQRQMSYPSFGPSRQITANRHLQISIPIWTFRFYNSFFLFFSFFCLLSFLYFFTHTYPPLFLSGDEFI